jgi:selenocysteine lyase/cysteine desulfurase
MAVSTGYKWLLGPYGTGFFWIAREWIERLPLGAVYYMGLSGARDLHTMFSRELVPAPGARRWDSAETASFANLMAFDASLDFVQRIGVGVIQQYIDALTNQIGDCMPRDRCVLASPAERQRRGPYVCVSAADASSTASLYEKLSAAQISVSLREGALRISPHIYNTPDEISRLIEVLKS